MATTHYNELSEMNRTSLRQASTAIRVSPSLYSLFDHTVIAGTIQ